MKTSVKAMIYSGIVFPGAGYFIIRRTYRALLSLAVTLVCLSFIIYEAIQKAHVIAEKIVSGQISYDVAAIQELIKNTPGVFSPEFISGMTIIIGLVWIVGLIDTYRLGKIYEVSHSAQQPDLDSSAG